MSKRKNKMTALLVALIMMLTMTPAMAFAGVNNAEDIPSSYGYDESDAESVGVYVTLSKDGMPLEGKDENETKMAYVKVDVPYFDLADYGLEEYYRYETEDGIGQYVNDTLVKRPTALHLYIYMTELYYLGLDKNECGKGTSGLLDNMDGLDVNYIDGDYAYTGEYNAFGCSGGPCSLYINGGFWGHDANLNYYRNHRYPLMLDGWGATADYVLLSDGDVIDIALNSDYFNIFYGYFLSFNKDDYEGNAEETLNVYTMSTARSASFGGETPIEEYTDEMNVELYDANWNKKDVEITSGGDGTYGVTLPKEAGTYYLLGTSTMAKDASCVDAPAVAKVIVNSTELEEPGNPEGPTEPEQPDNPEGPASPEQPGNPENPAGPEQPGNLENPTEPEQPGNTSDLDGETDVAVKTGDEFNVMVPLLLSVLAMGLIAVLVITNRRKVNSR